MEEQRTVTDSTEETKEPISRDAKRENVLRAYALLMKGHPSSPTNTAGSEDDVLTSAEEEKGVEGSPLGIEGPTENPKPKRRNRPGTRNEDMNKWSDLPFEKMEGPLAVEEYLQQLIRRDPSAIQQLMVVPAGVSKDVWIYEHLRQLVKELNLFIVHHSDVCTEETAPVMKIIVGSEEYTFRSPVFTPPRECSAIDYMVHTVSQATSILNSNTYFPSRLMIKKTSTKQFSVLARRLYRLFAFSYFTYRDKFESFEEQTHLCERFTRLALTYQLISTKELLIPMSEWY
ncbi:MOB member 4, phocein [Balamuthia mandrillaris]